MLEDLQRLASLALDDYREALLAHPDAIVLPAEDIAAGRVYVAETGGEPSGLLVLVPADSGEVEIDGLFVRPDAWRHGIGRALLTRARAIAEQERAPALVVVASPSAQEFYSASGFVLTGVTQTRFGEALTMRLALAGA